MGILNRKEAGYRCETLDENGEIHHCTLFDIDRGKNEKDTTGTDFTFSTSKQNNCDPIMMGNHDILEKDEKKVKDIIDARVKGCRRGIG